MGASAATALLALGCGPLDTPQPESGFVLESAELGLAFDESSTLDVHGSRVGPTQMAVLVLQPVDESMQRHDAGFTAVDADGNRSAGRFELRIEESPAPAE